eukprot:ANDGO_06764.mRNA.1 Alpha-latrocrustotoxin-Lt1a
MELIRAADVGAYDEVVHLVESSNVDINYQNETGNSALHIASQRGHEKIVCYLVEHGADISLENKEQKTPMQLAAPRLRGVMKATKEIQELYKRLEASSQPMDSTELE